MEVFKGPFLLQDNILSTEERAVWKLLNVEYSPPGAVLPRCGWRIVVLKEVEQDGRGFFIIFFLLLFKIYFFVVI